MKSIGSTNQHTKLQVEQASAWWLTLKAKLMIRLQTLHMVISPSLCRLH